MRNSMSVGKDTWKPSMLVLTMVLIHGYCYDKKIGGARTEKDVKCKLLLKHQCNCKGNVWRSSKCFGQFKPNNNAPYGNTYNSSWRNHPNFSWKPRAPQYQQPAQPSQQASSLEQAIVNLSKIDNLQYSISRLTNLNTVQEKGRFPSQPHQNPRVSMKWKLMRENLHSHDWRKGSGKALLDLGASVNLLPYSVYKQLGLGELKPTSITLSLADRSVKFQGGNGLMQLTFGNMTLELNIFYMSKKQITPEEEEGPERLERREEILPLFNKEEAQKLLRRDPKAQFEASAHGEKCLLEVLKRCKKAIGWQISDLKGISPLVCTHHIYMEEEAKPIRQPQRRLNPHLQEVVRAEVLKLLQADQEKTTFTCPFGTYAYRRMPFGLCNAPATFQRFNLEAVLNRCIEKDLVLNWEKCHFMVHQGIVLGHIISEKGIEVDKAKDAKFIWDERCQKSFDQLKQFLTTTPIVRAPNWQLHLKMCDASDFAIGVVLGQREDGSPM
ncbi:hypothetical protein CK203_049682 [Vitis vinifera]|uniref:Reverse transcriptase/retrotransposon-derived protein RNase H-like domain-containing protein n=1 Tax=Vitis vinifera TaxID=29760 RepID=A0A438CSS7_VITVI|nr:hypothetical protein CK203_108882 [Vitis vinifera]RVW66654.1 hypothetical protein CK203_066488 [Vitis vinifera]RVW76618.1 hypothetical protein CK203_049682 [Vitis vinifera]